ncbi:hypothetical protein ACFLQ0_02055 [Nitrospinota bacterium]
MLKLLTCGYRGVPHVGVYVGDKIAHIARLSGFLGRGVVNPSSMVDLIENWDELGPRVRALVADAEKNADDLAPVLMNPGDVFVTGAPSGWAMRARRPPSFIRGMWSRAWSVSSTRSWRRSRSRRGC